jgi:RNA polymerase sigma-70 factor (ECF subfamily)
MVTISQSPSNGSELLLRRIGGGDHEALPELFVRVRRRLRRMVRLRIDPRLQDRVDPEDVLDQAYRDVLQHGREYLSDPKLSPFVWMRQLANRRLSDAQSRFLKPGAVEVNQEVSLFQGPLPHVSSMSLAAMLLGEHSQPVQEAHRATKQIRLQEALKQMGSIDREVLVLRHFEMLNNDETAEVLGLTRSEASRYYLRALKLVKDVMLDTPGFSV